MWFELKLSESSFKNPKIFIGLSYSKCSNRWRIVQFFYRPENVYGLKVSRIFLMGLFRPYFCISIFSIKINVQNHLHKIAYCWIRTESNGSANCAITTATSPGLVVMGDDSCSRGHGFESRCRILDGHFSHWFVIKIVLFVWKDQK